MTLTNPKQERLKIGEVANISGLSVKTIRYYEEIGLLTPTVLRAESRYRLFDKDVMQRLGFIKRAQALGLSLTEVKEVLTVHDQGQLPCDEVRHHLQAKIEEIDHKVAVLMQQRSQLKTILSHWDENPSMGDQASVICPNLQSKTSGIGSQEADGSPPEAMRSLVK